MDCHNCKESTALIEAAKAALEAAEMGNHAGGEITDMLRKAIATAKGGVKMRRFLLFAGETYYPAGGFNDYQESFNTQIEAFDAGRNLITEEKYTGWFHVVDDVNGKILSEEGDLL